MINFGFPKPCGYRAYRVIVRIFFSRFFANFRGEGQEGGKGTEIIVFDKKKIMKIWLA